MSEQRPVLVGYRNIARLLQPLHEARHRRQRHEILQLRQFAPQFLDHLLDQEVAEGNSAETALGVGDRIEHRGAGALDRNRPPVFGEQWRDRGGNRFRQRHLDEDQGFVDQGGMEECIAAPVDGVDAAARISCTASYRMICSRMFAGVDQSILRSTRNPLLNQEDSKCTTSRSSAAKSLWPFMAPSRSARMATSALVPPGARLSWRINSCRRGSEAK